MGNIVIKGKKYGKSGKISLVPMPRQRDLGDLFLMSPGQLKCDKKGFIRIPLSNFQEIRPLGTVYVNFIRMVAIETETLTKISTSIFGFYLQVL